MSRPRILDLFGCAGGAGEGYRRAGFDVVSVDIEPQPHNPHEFIEADAFEFFDAHGHEFDAWHASPPCHDHSALVTTSGSDDTAWMLRAIRERFRNGVRPWVIENVEGAEMGFNTLTLCGTQFGLSTVTAQKGVVWLKRHRQFESNVRLIPPDGHRQCVRGKRVIGVYGTGNGYDRDASASRGGWQGTFEDRKAVMGIDWMNRRELSQAIPPAYTQFIGAQLLDALVVAA